mgnify:CR=1 FL=1
MQALDQESDKILCAMENPMRSELWEMDCVKSAMEKNDQKWVLKTVDQCAYGRKCKKTTRILTNIVEWKLVGITGNGRCKALKCGGTKTNKAGPGQGRHEQQMIAKDPKRKPREGVIIEGNRREYSIKAGKNLVQAQLVKEIVEAAMRQEENNTQRTRTTEGRKRKNQKEDLGEIGIDQEHSWGEVRKHRGHDEDRLDAVGKIRKGVG